MATAAYRVSVRFLSNTDPNCRRAHFDLPVIHSFLLYRWLTEQRELAATVTHLVCVALRARRILGELQPQISGFIEGKLAVPVLSQSFYAATCNSEVVPWFLTAGESARAGFVSDFFSSLPGTLSFVLSV